MQIVETDKICEESMLFISRQMKGKEKGRNHEEVVHCDSLSEAVLGHRECT